ncbi:MAG: hypothetical protein R2874_08115 [Desulfobacterales bacterium]
MGDSAKQLVGHLNKNMTAMNEIFEALRELQIFNETYFSRKTAAERITA